MAGSENNKREDLTDNEDGIITKDNKKCGENSVKARNPRRNVLCRAAAKDTHLPQNLYLLMPIQGRGVLGYAPSIAPHAHHSHAEHSNYF